MISRIVLRPTAAYLTAAERSEIENYLATAKGRRIAIEEVRRQVVPIIDRVIARQRAMYPQFAKFHPQGFEKGHRDLVLLTNMAANAMFLGEHDTMDDQFTEWYRTVTKGTHTSPQFVRDTFSVWLDELESQLSDDTYALLRPHAEHLASYLTNVPVPARDETGERVAPQHASGVAL